MMISGSCQDWKFITIKIRKYVLYARMGCKIMLPRPHPSSYPKPTPKRLPGRKLVTLIFAWRCSDGVVMCADSQEVAGDHRRTVQKISPEKIGNFQVILAGSGTTTLIESFIVVLRRAIKASQYTDLEEFEALAEKTLEDFYNLDVRLCPEADKSVSLFIAAVSEIAPHKYQVWMTQNTRLVPIGAKCELIGWDIPLYSGIMQRFEHEGMNLNQAVLAGIYLFAIAAKTSLYVSEPISVAIIWGGGITMQDSQYIESTAMRLKDYERRINDIFLQCADSSIPVYKLQETLAQFSSDSLFLHRCHLDQVVNSMRREDIMEANDFLPKLPLGSPLTLHGNGALSIDHNKETIESARETFRRLIKETDEAIRKLGLRDSTKLGP
jgi:hypothetical protein